MRHPGIVILSLGASVLLGGCVGTGPNTQQGAVAGGALGALAGGIIGNNSGSHNGASGALIGALAGALAGGTLGNSMDNERGTLYRPPQSAVTGYTVQQVPQPPAEPPSTEVVSTPPSPSALWIPGYWAFDGARYVWVAGHWEIPPPNCRTYVAPYWANQGGTYVYIRGYWR